MTTLHYVWCGGNKDVKYKEPATMGPNSANRLWHTCFGKDGKPPGFEIKYWFSGGEEIFQFAGDLDSPGQIEQIHVRSTSDLFADGKLSARTVEGEKLIDYIIRKLLEGRMYSAAKDLMSMCILWQHGGVYMDTTTVLDTENIGAQLLIKPNHAMFMQVPGGDKSATFMSGKKGEKAKYVARDMNRTVMNPKKDLKTFKKGVIGTYNVDVWGISAPKKDDLIYKIIEGYVSRCEFLFNVKESSTKIADNWNNLQDMRNGIVSRLIMDSVFNGLHQMWKQKSWFTKRRGSFDEFVRAHSFDVQKIKEGEHTKGKCEALGLAKYHGKASWRTA